MDSIQSFLPPTDSKQLQQFLGMISFYRKFLPINGAALLKRLYEAVKGTHKKTQLNWTSDMQTAFNAAKCSLSASATLALPLPNSTIALTADASDWSMLRTTHRTRLTAHFVLQQETEEK